MATSTNSAERRSEARARAAEEFSRCRCSTESPLRAGLSSPAISHVLEDAGRRLSRETETFLAAVRSRFKLEADLCENMTIDEQTCRIVDWVGRTYADQQGERSHVQVLAGRG
jgi:hypothetical protein